MSQGHSAARRIVRTAVVATITASALLLGAWVVSALFFGPKARQTPIVEDCNMNGYAVGECKFTNTGNDVAQLCGRIHVVCGTTTAESPALCSGRLQARASAMQSFQFPSLASVIRDSVPAGADWNQACQFGFVPAPGIHEPEVVAHASGADPETLAQLDWLRSEGLELRRAVQTACGGILLCADYSDGQDVATTAPCLRQHIPECEAAVRSLRAAEIPEPFRAGFGSLADEGEYNLCYGEAIVRLMESDARMVDRVRRTRSMMGEPESPENWASNNPRYPVGARFLAEYRACPSHLIDNRRWPEVDSWLQEHFCCEPLGVYYIGKLESLTERGIEPGPAPECE